jgi:hypothetical protein
LLNFHFIFFVGCRYTLQGPPTLTPTQPEQECDVVVTVPSHFFILTVTGVSGAHQHPSWTLDAPSIVYFTHELPSVSASYSFANTVEFPSLQGNAVAPLELDSPLPLLVEETDEFGVKLVPVQPSGFSPLTPLQPILVIVVPEGMVIVPLAGAVIVILDTPFVFQLETSVFLHA